MTLAFERYRKVIQIDEVFETPDCDWISERQIDQILDQLLEILTSETGYFSHYNIEEPNTGKDRRRLLQHLLTVRPPLPMQEHFLNLMDRLQAWETKQLIITNSKTLAMMSNQFPESKYPATKHCALWQGDISKLNVDAIVNAANDNMLGCFTPFHACIDNIIHCAAGPRLRQDCHTIMEMQGHLEKTGRAKITRGYHLPSRYVLHTVGPIYAEEKAVASQHLQLMSCYNHCLDLAAKVPEIQNLAFCCISTGVFGFPQEKAAQIALNTVSKWINKHPGRLNVIFNVFSDPDHDVYKEIILNWKNEADESSL